MKKLALIFSTVFFTNTLSQASLDDILIPKITWEQLEKIYATYGVGTDLKQEINSLIHQAERKYGIPHGLLSAIAYTESGRYMPSQNDKIIWPWTVNACGRSYYLKDKNEAIATVHKLKKAGINIIDVGCMQVNLVYHGKAFKSIEDAFVPKTNIEYAAKMLRDLYNSQKSWDKAVCYYHSKTKEKYSKYYAKIMKAYKNTAKARIVVRPEIPVYTLCKNNKKTAVQTKTLDDVIAERLHKIGKSVLAKEKTV